jgi:hypothetical protein
MNRTSILGVIKNPLMNRTSKAKRPDNSQVLDTPGPG